MGNDTLIRKKFCWPYGKPTLREWDGEDHPVNVYNAATGEFLRIEGGLYFGDIADPNALPRFGRRY